MDQGDETTNSGSHVFRIESGACTVSKKHIEWTELVFQRLAALHLPPLTPSYRSTGQGLEETRYRNKQRIDLPLSQTLRSSEKDKCECGKTLRQESVSRLTCWPVLFLVLTGLDVPQIQLVLHCDCFPNQGCYDLERKELYSIDIWKVTHRRTAFLFGCCPFRSFFKNRKTSILQSLKSQCLFLLAYRGELSTLIFCSP